MHLLNITPHTQLVSPSDIAIYTMLCALATLDTPTIRQKLIENDTFGAYMEYEPYVRDMLEAFMGNRFKAMLEILERNSVRTSCVIYEYASS